MNLKLVHFNEALIDNYLMLIRKGVVRQPEIESYSSTFLLTEENQKNQLRNTFERLSAAKIIVEGNVVPNLVV
jgi:calcineurin-like phosphoesterase family protein